MTLPIRIGDTIRAAAVFTACLPYSDSLFAESTWTQASEDWLASHVRLFAHLGGVPGKLVPDNLKTGITHASFFDPVVNRDYLELAQHYTVAVVPTRTRHPRDKASVENGVLQVERRVLAPLRHRTFGSLEEANRAIAAQLALVNGEPLSVNRAASRLSLFRGEEQPALRPLPPEPFAIGRWSRLKVPPDYHVGIEGVAYWVSEEPWHCAGYGQAAANVTMSADRRVIMIGAFMPFSARRSRRRPEAPHQARSSRRGCTATGQPPRSPRTCPCGQSAGP